MKMPHEVRKWWPSACRCVVERGTPGSSLLQLIVIARDLLNFNSAPPCLRIKGTFDAVRAANASPSSLPSPSPTHALFSMLNVLR